MVIECDLNPEFERHVSSYCSGKESSVIKTQENDCEDGALDKSPTENLDDIEDNKNDCEEGEEAVDGESNG